MAMALRISSLMREVSAQKSNRIVSRFDYLALSHGTDRLDEAG
jgi:hypothetical protein